MWTPYSEVRMPAKKHLQMIVEDKAITHRAHQCSHNSFHQCVLFCRSPNSDMEKYLKKIEHVSFWDYLESQQFAGPLSYDWPRQASPDNDEVIFLLESIQPSELLPAHTVSVLLQWVCCNCRFKLLQFYLYVILLSGFPSAKLLSLSHMGLVQNNLIAFKRMINSKNKYGCVIVIAPVGGHSCCAPWVGPKRESS